MKILGCAMIAAPVVVLLCLFALLAIFGDGHD